MDIDKSVRLRPRFQHKTSLEKAKLVERIQILKSKYKAKFKLTQSDNHLWIHHHKSREKIFTPNLHLEIIEDNKPKTTIKGLYSPNNSYWTLFIFLHLILACLFIGFAIMAYTKSVVNSPFMLYVYLMFVVILVWIGLYFFARYNRKRGLSQAYELESVFREWVKN
ncbi:hypothetical protein [Flavobacteriaceae bacterium 14752]|uniref:hypothetical protein n=1 Tax=Mesohalobacter salilacus TaxID=2491711 RepID=UPI000F637AC4|nr:hypothetical protein EIG84_07960 [Flavobacteriaceae bacterium 14752]